jgi:hypothetical protein
VNIVLEPAAAVVVVVVVPDSYFPFRLVRHMHVFHC